MQGGERTKAGRKLAAAAAAAAAAAQTAPIPPRLADPEAPEPAEKAALAAADVADAEREGRAAAAEPATISRSVSVIFAEVTEARLRRWRRTGGVELHGAGGGVGREGLGEVEARMSLSDVKLVTSTAK